MKIDLRNQENAAFFSGRLCRVEEPDEPSTQRRRGGLVWTGVREAPASFFPPNRKMRWMSHDAWLGQRARLAAVMLRGCAEYNPQKCGGVPVLRGTRFTLAQFLAELADGRNVFEISEDFDIDAETAVEFLRGLSIYLDRPVGT